MRCGSFWGITVQHIDVLNIDNKKHKTSSTVIYIWLGFYAFHRFDAIYLGCFIGCKDDYMFYVNENSCWFNENNSVNEKSPSDYANESQFMHEGWEICLCEYIKLAKMLCVQKWFRFYTIYFLPFVTVCSCWCVSSTPNQYHNKIQNVNKKMVSELFITAFKPF